VCLDASDLPSNGQLPAVISQSVQPAAGAARQEQPARPRVVAVDVLAIGTARG
jgi:hypothetical protein